MKANVLNIQGEKVKDIELPKCFSAPIREDIMLKIYEISKKKQPYAPFYLAGKQASASGKIRHARRKWKTSYGYGISRVPRKIMSRSGTRFNWVGATVASARGGRAAHPPKIVHILKEKRLNKKEKSAALFSAISASASINSISKAYSFAANKKISVPLVIDSLNEAKSKDVMKFINKALSDLKQGNKVLVVISSKEKFKTKMFEVVKAKELSVSKLCPTGLNGRFVLYTQEALNEMEKLK